MTNEPKPRSNGISWRGSEIWQASERVHVVFWAGTRECLFFTIEKFDSVVLPLFCPASLSGINKFREKNGTRNLSCCENNFCTDKEFLPGSNNFVKFFSSKWFKVMYYLLIFAKFGFHFFCFESRKKRSNLIGHVERYVKAFWLKLGTHLWHTLRTLSWSIDCLIDQIEMHQQAHSLARFIPMAISSRIWTNLALLNKNIIQKWFFRFLSSFSVNRTLVHDQKTDISELVV